MELKDLGLQFIPSRLKSGNIPKEGFLHHTGGIRTVEEYHQMHIEKGWAGLGYNAIVDLNGIAYKGRPIEYVPAGISGHNTNTIHIAAIGNFDNMEMPDVQKRAIQELVEYYEKEYGIKFRGHREVAATACPGKNYPLEEIKSYEAPIEVKPTPSPIHASVFKLQHALNLAGITDKYGNRLKEDGWMGPLTMSAIAKKEAIVRRGDKSPLVGWIQERLGIKVDNDYGNVPYHQTYDAIIKFQKSMGLDVDSVVGPQTWAALVMGL